ncbi:MAG TPA: hypothetical protein VJV40_08150 [Thermodesulfobacteriota bacterium]|nr:hypothetical protein [Thermodesulfobacteriota bacterium]
MKRLIVLGSFVVTVVLAVAVPASTSFAEGVSRVSSESETVSAAPGKSISVKSGCPRGTQLIGGGGECFGFLVTEGRAGLSRSAPAPDGYSWYVECVNSGTRPGDIQARAWAMCADSNIFEPVKKK